MLECLKTEDSNFWWLLSLTNCLPRHKKIPRIKDFCLNKETFSGFETDPAKTIVRENLFGGLKKILKSLRCLTHIGSSLAECFILLRRILMGEVAFSLTAS
ncbi:hypothetical protein AVEN_36041-1 [Araneus ventricosus]|uniref:Uncharacterized protein n=1 Tax=Araneus ventricosus TaxID=182803 RepID=A0A4Y2R101_ARAVE|nr:hypothetical protein AVEN_36041-1 [Araneus ventricosus]